MDTSNLIALLSAIIAILSAIYAHRSNKQSRHANQIAIQNALRPDRLFVYTTIAEFLNYCLTYYYGVLSSGELDRTKRLTAAIQNFKWTIEQRGSLEMPKVEELTEKICTQAWQLQRLIDRLNSSDQKPVDRRYSNAQENLDGLIDWFSEQRHDLSSTFEEYIKFTQPAG